MHDIAKNQPTFMLCLEGGNDASGLPNRTHHIKGNGKCDYCGRTRSSINAEHDYFVDDPDHITWYDDEAEHGDALSSLAQLNGSGLVHAYLTGNGHRVTGTAYVVTASRAAWIDTALRS